MRFNSTIDRTAEKLYNIYIDISYRQAGKEENMRFAVISDIHSNYMALENALCMIDRLKPDGIIFLGDYLTDFP